MAAVTDFPPRSNEDWLVYRAKTCMKSDPFAAKAWLITARTLFPRNFTIQYEAYNIEKSSKNTKEATKLLEEMLCNFAQETQLWNEVRSLCDALQSDAVDEKTLFLKELFGLLPPNLQCHMLLQVVDNTQDILEQCRLTLLILRRYPDRIPQHGVKLIDSLLSAEKHAHCPTAVNCYRKYLVYDVLPLVLKVSLQEVPAKHIIRWLQKAIEFYVCYDTQPPSESQQNPGTDLLSPSKKAAFLSPGGRRVSISGLPEKEAQISRPWDQLFQVIHLVAVQLGWNMGNLFTSANMDSQWQQLHTLHENINQQTGSEAASSQKQLLYCTMVLFLQSLHHYSLKMDPDQFTGASGSGQPLVLIEGFKSSASQSSYEHRSKKLKLDAGTPHITASPNVTSSPDLIQNFTTALKCWQLLHSADILEKEFAKLCVHWKTSSWPWLKSFEIDVLIYQGMFHEAVSRIQGSPAGIKHSTAQMRSDLQLACCYFCTGNLSKSCETILNVVSMLPQGSSPSSQQVTAAAGVRQLNILTCSESEILPYCIQLLVTCFKEKAFRSAVIDDMSLGHMIVLLQYDWPRNEHLFTQVVERIQTHGSFSYNIFFNYVINIDILEEFAFIKTVEGGRVTLDILPTSTKAIAQQRTVTRGVNKGVKEDFKATMEKQVSRSQENVETIIRQFLVEEKDVIQQNLL